MELLFVKLENKTPQLRRDRVSRRAKSSHLREKLGFRKSVTLTCNRQSKQIESQLDGFGQISHDNFMLATTAFH